MAITVEGASNAPSNALLADHLWLGNSIAVAKLTTAADWWIFP